MRFAPHRTILVDLFDSDLFLDWDHPDPETEIAEAHLEGGSTRFVGRANAEGGTCNCCAKAGEQIERLVVYRIEPDEHIRGSSVRFNKYLGFLNPGLTSS